MERSQNWPDLRSPISKFRDKHFIDIITDINRWKFQSDLAFGVAMTCFQTFSEVKSLVTWSPDLSAGGGSNTRGPAPVNNPSGWVPTLCSDVSPSARTRSTSWRITGSSGTGARCRTWYRRTVRPAPTCRPSGAGYSGAVDWRTSPCAAPPGTAGCCSWPPQSEPPIYRYVAGVPARGTGTHVYRHMVLVLGCTGTWYWYSGVPVRGTGTQVYRRVVPALSLTCTGLQ